MSIKIDDLDPATRAKLRLMRAVKRPASKYGARRCYVDPFGRVIDLPKRGVVPDGCERFDSRREAYRYATLRAMLRVGEISDLVRQVKFPLFTVRNDRPLLEVVELAPVSTYVADFVYRRGGHLVVEDCKGFRTPLYKLKKKWLSAQEGIEIYET